MPNNNGNHPQRRGKLTWTRIEELIKIGPAQFCQKYRYLSQAKSAVFRIHNRLERAAEQRPQPAPDLRPPEAIQEAISLLPPRGRELNDQRRELLKGLLAHAIDMAYTPERR